MGATSGKFPSYQKHEGVNRSFAELSFLKSASDSITRQLPTLQQGVLSVMQSVGRLCEEHEHSLKQMAELASGLDFVDCRPGAGDRAFQNFSEVKDTWGIMTPQKSEEPIQCLLGGHYYQTPNLSGSQGGATGCIHVSVCVPHHVDLNRYSPNIGGLLWIWMTETTL